MKAFIFRLPVIGPAVLYTTELNSWFNEEFIDYVEAMPFTFGDGSL